MAFCSRKSGSKREISDLRQIRSSAAGVLEIREGVQLSILVDFIRFGYTSNTSVGSVMCTLPGILQLLGISCLKCDTINNMSRTYVYGYVCCSFDRNTLRRGYAYQVCIYSKYSTRIASYCCSLCQFYCGINRADSMAATFFFVLSRVFSDSCDTATGGQVTGFLGGLVEQLPVQTSAELFTLYDRVRVRSRDREFVAIALLTAGMI